MGSSPSIGSKNVLIKLHFGEDISGRYSSGQRGQTVNLLVLPSQVRILLSPLLGFILMTQFDLGTVNSKILREARNEYSFRDQVMRSACGMNISVKKCGIHFL